MADGCNVCGDARAKGMDSRYKIVKKVTNIAITRIRCAHLAHSKLKQPVLHNWWQFSSLHTALLPNLRSLSGIRLLVLATIWNMKNRGVDAPSQAENRPVKDSL